MYIFVKQDVIHVPMATSSTTASETDEDGDFLVTKLLLRETVRPADTGGRGLGGQEQLLELSPDKTHSNLHELTL